MNKLLTLLIVFLIPILGKAQTDYKIKGKIPKTNRATQAILSYPPDDQGGPYKTDTVEIKSGKFTFKGSIGRPQMAELNLITPEDQRDGRGQANAKGGMYNVAIFYLDGNIRVTFDTTGMASYSGGGKTQKSWEEYHEWTVAANQDLEGAPVGMQFFEDLISRFVKAHPDSYVSVDLMDLFTQNAIRPDLVEPMYNALSKRMQNSEKVLAWKERLDEAKAFSTGTIPAKDFTLNDIEGNPVSLTSYRGGYVLVDFWASWCVPCRAENPNIVAAYTKYKDKNFKVLGVSLDDDKALWLKAIAEDKLPWKQVCDFKAGQSEVVKLYNISSIPANVLIDPNGMIVGKDLRGEALHNRLAELINE